MLQLEPGMVIWTWITFAILFVVLSRVAWKPLLGMVEAREKEINDALNKANTAREEAEKLMAEQQQRLSAAQDEMQEMINEGKKMAETMKSDILNQAQEEAEKLRRRAKADIDRERAAAITSLKNEVADIVVDATARLVGVVVDKKKHGNLIDEAISDFGRKN